MTVISVFPVFFSVPFPDFVPPCESLYGDGERDLSGIGLLGYGRQQLAHRPRHAAFAQDAVRGLGGQTGLVEISLTSSLL
jgi:hypothetical protein